MLPLVLLLLELGALALQQLELLVRADLLV
jgi:hypothetical protein